MTDNKNETAGPPKEDVQPVPNQEQTSDNKPPESSQAPTIVNAVPVTSEHQNPPSTEEQKQEEKKDVKEKEQEKKEEKKPSKPSSKQGTKPASKQGAKPTTQATKGKKKDGGKKEGGKKGKKGKDKEKEQAEKEAEEKRLEMQRLEEERKKKEEEERLKKEEEERLKKEEEERLRLEEEKRKKKEEDEDKRVIFLVQCLIESSFVKDKNDERLTKDIVNKLFDFLDKPKCVQLFLKFKDEKEDELICRENILELYDPTINKESQDNFSGMQNFVSRSDYEFFFFFKKKPCRITKKNMHEQIVYDKVDGNIDKYLLDKMKESLSDRIFNLNWPEGIKNDLISNMHKFLIILNQSYFQELNKVVLYIPRENVSGSEASKDKELVARLESIMIEWTNQIRDFLSNQDNASNREDFDINEEISYLESRNSNLAAISDQLENKELIDIVNTLSKTRASSENLKGFKDLKDKILEQKYITSDTHRFLKILKSPCDKIRNPKTEIKEIKPILMEIMNKIRVITEFCDTYKTPEDVDNLLKKVSFQLIHKFTQKIQENDKNIMTEYNDKLYQNILDINKCINDWVSIYNQFQERIEMFEKNEELKKKWKKDKKHSQTVFYELETFQKRCNNLEEICLCQLQFGKNKNSSINPIWGGTKRFEITKQLNDIKEKFDDKMYMLFKSGNNVLNTKVNKWQEEFRIFSKHVEDLEDMYKNTISSAFKRVNTLEEAVNYVENFYSLAKLQKIKNYIKNDIALEVIYIYTNEIEQMNEKNNQKTFVRMNMQTAEGSNTLWSKYLSLRMEDYEKLIQRMNTILLGKNSKEELPYEKNKKMEELRKELKTLKGSVKAYLQGENPIVRDELDALSKIDQNKLMDKLKHPLIVELVQTSQFNRSEEIFFKLYQCNYPSELMKYSAYVNCYSRFEEFSITGDTVKFIKELETQKRRIRELVINACREYNHLVLSVKKETEKIIFKEEFNKLINDNVMRLQNNYWNQQGGFDKVINQVRTKVKEMSKMINEFKSHSMKINDICEQISKKLFFHIEKNADIYNKDDFILEQERVCKETSQFIEEKATEIIDLLMKSYSFISNVDEVEVFKGFKAYIEEISKKGFNDALERSLTNSIITMHRAMLGEGGNAYLSAFFRVDVLLSEGKFKKSNYKFEPDDKELTTIINNTVARMKSSAESAPEIYSLFTKRNPDFEKKLKNTFGSKKTDKNINSLNAIKEENAEEDKALDKTKKGKKGKKADKAKAQRGVPQFLQSTEKVEKEKARFPKAEEAKKIFNNDLKTNQLDKKFQTIIQPWISNDRLKPFQQILQESENVRKIDSVFKSFLQEGNSDKLISALNDYIIAINRLKTDDLSNADSREIPPTIVSKLFIQFDSTKVKNKLIELCEGIISFDLNYITKKTKTELIDKVNQEFDEHEIKFRKEPETQDDWKTLWEELKKAEAEKDDRFKMITGANDVVSNVIQNNSTNRPNEELFKQVEDLEKRKDVYTALLEDSKKILNDARNKLSSQVAEQEKKFIDDVDEMQRNFLGQIPDKLECKLQEEIEKTYEAQKILKKYADQCAKLEEEEKSVTKGINLFWDIFHKSPQSNKTLLDVKDQIKELNKIWNIKAAMNEIVKRWRETQFYEFNLDEMEKERMQIENRLRNECKELTKKPIYITMKDQLDLYKALIEVLVLLRDDAMTKNEQSHWEKVQNTLGLSNLEPKSIDFNFEKIIELKLEMYREQIEKIVKYAREQLKLDQGLEAIKAEWKIKELKFEFKAKTENTDGDFRLLPENKAWVDALESHLAKIAEYKSTPYYEDFKEKIDNLETELNKFSDLYQLLKQVQDKRNYLKNIFSKDIDDIYQQAGNDIAVYKTNNEKFLEICSSFNAKKLVRECFNQEKLENDLNDLFYKFSEVERSMNSLLDTKRQTFKRFYFLSNDDLFELMGNSFDMKVINQHLTKLFTGVERIKIEQPTRKKDENPFINNIYDSMEHGEKLKLDNSVIVISMVETWMNDLEKAMISTLENNLSKAYKKFMEFPKSFELDLDEKIDKSDKNAEKMELIKYIMKKKFGITGQALLTLTNFGWRVKLERELIEASKSEKKNVEWDNQMNYLTTCVTKAAAYLDKRKKKDLQKKYVIILYNYILLMKYLYELTSNLKNENVRSTENYEWQKLLKINFVNKKDIMSTNMFQRNRNRNITEEKYIVQMEQLQNKANYGYEYIGNKERLVITPVTERCFLNMMTAIFYFRGGALQGPAGTGKTETIKDLSRAMGKYVIVFNCSNKNSYNTMATLFLGVINTGAWVCFDEFNRIEVEVLSVIRIQLITIFDALRSKKISIPFKGNAGVRINHSLAIYITMNPQYIFRTELPDNLKILFRPVALKAADRQRICEIKFLADGYPAQIANSLAKLLIVSLDVLMQQLSPQSHYDFSLRAIMNILKYASSLKSMQGHDEMFVLRMAICDMLKPKLTANDEEIFDNVLSSVFNDGLQGDGADLNEQIEKAKQERQENLRNEVKQIIEMKKLTGSPFLINQVIQLYNNMQLKHGLMLVGGTLSGKTTTLELLKKLNEVQKAKPQPKNKKDKEDEFTDIEIRRIFPKSIELDELYGRIGSDGQYHDGLLPFHLKDISNTRYDDGKSRTIKWLVLDSPVDTLWIESLNTLLDETRMLSLPSGFRINLKRDIKVVFEAEELTSATPATISRVGLIFFDQDKLGWFPMARKWLDEHKASKEWYELIAKWFDKYVYGILEELETMNLGYLCKMSGSQIIVNLIKIYAAFIPELNSINPYLKSEEEKAMDKKANQTKMESMAQTLNEPKEAKEQNKDAKKEEEEEEEEDNGAENTKYWEMAERLFVFALMWAIGGPLGEQGRIKVDNLIRKYSANFPANTLIFDFFVNPDKDDWATWDEKMIQGWTPNQNSLYSEIFVPTVDITRNRIIILNMLKNNQSPFILGGVATGKSSIIKMIYNTLELTKYQPFTVNLSYGITSKNLQKEIEMHFEKRNNKLYPPSNKRSLCYVDDLNLPKEDQFGSKTIVEMLRQYMELEGWYSVDSLNYVNIKSMLLLCSTCIRNADEQSNISQRFLSKFVPICIQTPNDQVKKKIFSTILAFYLSSSQSEDVKKLNEGLAMAAIGLYKAVATFQDFQPTPSKCYFIFNMHDLTKIFEAISKVSGNSKTGAQSYFTKEYFVKIFTHEAFRTYSDRFLSQEDKSHFKDFLSRQIEAYLGMSYNDTLMKDQRECIYIDPIPEKDENGNYDRSIRPFEEITEFEELKKTVVNAAQSMRKYQDMVFFDNSIYNIFFLRRIIYKSVGGHGILIGLGSSGRTSYVKIASDLCGFTTNIFNGARDANEGIWVDFIKKMIREAAGFNKQISLVIKERDFFCQLMIEHIHYLISIGFVPNLYSPSDWEEIKVGSASPEIQSMTMDAFQSYFIKNLKDNLRIFMSFSPYGEKLRDYVRKYPSIIDHTTCLSFTDWPEAALKEVANKKIVMENLIVQEDTNKKPKEEKKEEEKEKKEDEGENGENANVTSEEDTKEAKISLLLGISDIFAQIHLGVSNNVIEVMKREMKREAYFTSQNFITLIDTFNQFLKEKVKAINLSIEKYRSGIQKIQIGKQKIEEMKTELEERSKIEAVKNRENQKLLDEIQEKQKNAVEQENDVKFQREKNAKNKDFFERNKKESEREMNLARIPMLEAIKLTQEKITRKKLSEFKAAGERPKETKEVFYALMAIFNKPQTWDAVKTYLQSLDFNLIQDVEHLPVTEKGNFPTIQKYSRNFDLAVLKNQSELMPDLAMYIQNVEKYFKAKWVAEVKQKNFMEANKKVLESMKNLEKLEKQLEDIKNEIASLQRQLNEGKENLARIKSESESIKAKLGRASSLANAFAKEEERWGASLKKNKELLKNVLGDIILASANLTYLGVFPEKYRTLLKNDWADLLRKKGIQYNPKFDFLNFISNQNEIQNWKIFGLPDDVTMVENAVIMKYSLRPSLIIDPQDQAIDWIKNMLLENENKPSTENLEVENVQGQSSSASNKKKAAIASLANRKYYECTTSMNAYLANMTKAMRENKTVIINNVGEFLPPDLEEFLKTFDKSKHSLYLRTKVPNPKFGPEVSTSVNIINFLVNEKGLEEQILSTVVRIEREEAENNIRNNIKKMFELQKSLDKNEENTLMKLNNAGDNYLDDDLLIQELEGSTKNSTANQKLIMETSQDIEKINASREEYRPLARKVSKYFFVLYLMNSVNNMYEFSLKHYISLFEKSVKLSTDPRNMGGDSSEDRIKSIEKVHLERVISYANQCLFEKDKLLFAFQLCLETIFSNDEEQKKEMEKKGLTKFMAQQKKDEMDEDNPQPKRTLGGMPTYDFFNIQEFSMLLSNDYGHVDDKMVKPSWINDQNAWSFLVSLEKIPDLKGIVASISHNSSDWHKWYQNKEIEELPVEWETKCKGTTNIRKLLFIKALRPDKIANGIRDFIENNLEVDLRQQGPNLNDIITKEINPDIPLLIVHGGGVEPSDNILQLWDEIKEKEEKEKEKVLDEDDEENREKEKEKKKKEKEKKEKEKEKGKKDEEEEIKPRCVITTLNQDQWPLTHQLLMDMAKVGGWVYVANTHLTLQGIPQFEKTLDDIKAMKPHPNFRIIISTNPHPNYPISLLQRCNKITFELPHGIGNNMALLFDDLSKEAAAESNANTINKYEKADNKASAFSKMVYSLAMFHSMLLERRKYKGYGWTKEYDFNNSDFKICLDILRTYSKKFITPQEFPWKAIQELICINYGSRFTNNKDSELLQTYAEHFFNPNLILDKNYNLSSSPDFPYPLLDDSLFEKFKNTTSSENTSSNRSDFYMRMCFYKEEAQKLRQEQPEVFGLHFNAEISSQIQDNLELLDSIRILNHDLVASAESKSTDEIVLNKIKFAREKLPKPLESDKKKFEMIIPDDANNAGEKGKSYNPINILLYQEAVKYNNLLDLINNDLINFEKALLGHITLTPQIQTAIHSISEDKIPVEWLCYYLSTKSFIHFIEDLNKRFEFFRMWIGNGLYTPTYYLGYFTNPNSFITAIKQRFSLINKVAFNNITLQFKVCSDNEDKAMKNTNGYVIQGIEIEGGYWDKKNMGIREEMVQELTNELPNIIITPTASEDRLPNFGANALLGDAVVEVTRNFPLYYIPIRGDYLGRNSYVMDITLNIVREKDKEGVEKSKEEILSYWIKKGTCLLLSKSD